MAAGPGAGDRVDLVHRQPTARQLPREDDGRDGERHQAHAGGVSPQFGMNLALQTAVAHIPATDDDLPEWPEYIEFD